MVAQLQSALAQVKAGKSGFLIQPIRFNNDVHLSVTYQNRKKDFQVVISKKDGGYIGVQKTWEF